MPSIKGTASVADARAMSKALKSTKFPSSFSKPVDLSKVNRNVMLEWIEKNIEKILGFEDEIVASTAANLFLPDDTIPGDNDLDPRRAQIDLAGFLGDEQAAVFAKELWGLLLDAQTSPHGIPTKILEEKKAEIARAKREQQEQQQQLQESRRHHHHSRYVHEASRRAEAAQHAVSHQNQRGDRWRNNNNEPPPPRHRNHDDYPHDRPPPPHLQHHRGPPGHYRGRDRDGGPPRPHFNRDNRRDGGPPPPREWDNHRDNNNNDHPVPVSPPHPSEQSERGPGEDRKMPADNNPRLPVQDEFGRAILPPRAAATSNNAKPSISRDGERDYHNNNRNNRGNRWDRSDRPSSRDRSRWDRNDDRAPAVSAGENNKAETMVKKPPAPESPGNNNTKDHDDSRLPDIADHADKSSGAPPKPAAKEHDDDRSSKSSASSSLSKDRQRRRKRKHRRHGDDHQDDNENDGEDDSYSKHRHRSRHRHKSSRKKSSRKRDRKDRDRDDDSVEQQYQDRKRSRDNNEGSRSKRDQSPGYNEYSD